MHKSLFTFFNYHAKIYMELLPAQTVAFIVAFPKRDRAGSFILASFGHIFPVV